MTGRERSDGDNGGWGDCPSGCGARVLGAAGQCWKCHAPLDGTAAFPRDTKLPNEHRLQAIDMRDYPEPALQDDLHERIAPAIGYTCVCMDEESAKAGCDCYDIGVKAERARIVAAGESLAASYDEKADKEYRNAQANPLGGAGLIYDGYREQARMVRVVMAKVMQGENHE